MKTTRVTIFTDDNDRMTVVDAGQDVNVNFSCASRQLFIVEHVEKEP